MKFYCKDEYNSFKELMMTAYAAVFKDEKEGFTATDVNVMELFGLALHILCDNLASEITKKRI